MLDFCLEIVGVIDSYTAGGGPPPRYKKRRTTLRPATVGHCVKIRERSMKQKISALTAVFGISVALMTTGGHYAQAQSSETGPGNPTLLKAISDLTAGLAAVTQAIQSLQTSVADVQNSVDAISASDQSNVRVTPAIAVVGPNYAVCFVTNVSTAAQAINTELLDRFGAVVQHLAITLQPGHSTNPIAHQAVGPGDFYVCRFTVTNGSRTDIRAAILNSLNSGGVTLELPAE